LARLVDSLRQPVERAAGLRFKTAPRSAMRTREQVRAYLLGKLDDELPPARMRGMETAYRLFGMLPDTLSLRALLLELYTEQVARTPEFWEMYRDQVQQQQATMPIFAKAPLVVREALIFPYLDGAEFMHWWATTGGHADTLPYGPRMPVSTEQILHPERYARR